MSKEIFRSRSYSSVVYFGIIPFITGSVILYMNLENIGTHVAGPYDFWTLAMILLSVGLIAFAFHQIFYKISVIILYDDEIEGKSMLNTRTVSLPYSENLQWKTWEVREKYSRYEILEISDGNEKITISSNLFPKYRTIKNLVQNKTEGIAIAKENITGLVIILLSCALICVCSLIYLYFFNTYHFTEENTAGAQFSLSYNPEKNTNGIIALYPEGLQHLDVETIADLGEKLEEAVLQYPYSDTDVYIFYFPNDEVEYYFETENKSDKPVEEPTALHVVGLDHFTKDKEGKDTYINILPLNTFNSYLKPPDTGSITMISIFGFACIVTVIGILETNRRES